MKTLFDHLFTPISIGARIAPNRLLANPVECNNATSNGSPSESTLERYRMLAKGMWGVVVVESTTASDNPRDRGVGVNSLLLNDLTADAFATLVSEFKSINTESLLFIQISTGKIGRGEAHTVLSTADIEKAQQHMIKACLLAAQVGFDGVDFKQCHNFLTSCLLSRNNMRRDRWGGNTLEQRARFFVEAIEMIRSGLNNTDSSKFLIGSKVSENDLNDLEDIIRLFDDKIGLDFINLSALGESVFNSTVLFMLSQAVKLMGTNMKVVCSGGTDSILDRDPLARINDLLGKKLSPDFVGFGRQSLADPLTPFKIMNHETEKINWCTRCQSCMKRLREQIAVDCDVFPMKT